MKNFILLLLILPMLVLAHDDEADFIDELVRSGDVTITFKPDGRASQVTCDTKKYTPKQCEHLCEHIFDFYQHHRKK